MPNVTDMAWMAGILDLKGRVTTKNNKQRVTPQTVLYVESRFKEIIQRLSSMVGTTYEHRSQPRVTPDWMRRACLEHCPEKHVHYPATMPNTYRWSITGIGAAVIIYNLNPFLTTDKFEPYFLSIIESFDPQTARGMHSVGKQIARLDQFGWLIPHGWEVLAVDPNGTIAQLEEASDSSSD